MSVDRGKSEVVIDIFFSFKDHDKYVIHAKLWRRRKFPFSKRSLPFLGQLLLRVFPLKRKLDLEPGPFVS